MTQVGSAEKAFDALAPLAFAQSREDLLEVAEFGEDGKLQRIEFDWSKKGNAKIPSWDNTISWEYQDFGPILNRRSELRKSGQMSARGNRKADARFGDTPNHKRDRRRTTNSNKLFFMTPKPGATSSKSFKSS